MQIDGYEGRIAFDATTACRGTEVMMDGMVNCGGWGMGAVILFAVIVLVLGNVAFARHLLWSSG